MDCTDCLKKVKVQKDWKAPVAEGQHPSARIVQFSQSSELRGDKTSQFACRLPKNGVAAEMFSQLSKSQPISIEFNDLAYTVPASRRKGQVKKERKSILNGVTGRFRPGELTAIMGPSGAGKSTLLNILAGYRVSNVTGSITVNGAARNLQTFRKIQAYIMQDDHILPCLSVDEAMHAAATLKLGPSFSEQQRKDTVNNVLESLGLSSCRSTRCIRLSGGQKKRLSIALELINNPPVMFFDEPTSGLDSNSCFSCVALLRSLAEGGRTVICTIHQPSSRIFQQFDNLYVLTGGRCIYRGTRANLLPALSSVGLHCPEYHNPADFVMEIASGEYGDWNMTLVQAAGNGASIQWVASDSTERLESSSTESSSAIELNHAGQDVDPGDDHTVPACTSILIHKNHNDEHDPVVAASDHSTAVVGVALDSGREQYRTSTITQFCVLLKRTCRSILRDRILTTTRVLSHVLFGLMIGCLYWNIGNDADRVYNNAAQLFFAVMFLLFSSLMPTILTFPLEMSVFRREYMNCWYSVKSYYLAKTIADLPFQIIFPLLYDVIVYFMTSQPFSVERFCMFCLITILTSIVAQSLGIVIGACCDIQLAVFLGPICMIPLILFSGFFVSLDEMPVWISWLSYVSFCRYSFEGLMLTIYGFDRDRLYCPTAFCMFKNPQHFLQKMDMGESQFWPNVVALSAMTVGLRLIGYFVLRFKLKLER